MIQIKKRTIWFYFILIMAACVSFVFTNVSYDAEYQLAMAYRMIKGDAMITQMWEPHQTSAFLCAVLMKIYLAVMGTTTGIVLYTQIAGLLIRGAIAVLMYRTIREYSGDIPGVLAGVFYLLISPKELLTPEFGNMQLWFGTLMFLALLRYFQKRKSVYLVLAAVSLCMAVFSYPSMILSYGAAAILIYYYTDKPWKNILLFTGVCAVIGGGFAGYLWIRIGLDTILSCLSAALAVEPTHTVSFVQKTWGHISNVLKIAGMLTATGAIGLGIEYIRHTVCIRRSGERCGFSAERGLLISWYVLMVFLLLNILSVKNRGGYGFPFLVILGLGFWKRSLLSEEEKRLYYSALWISGMSLLATLVLSDNAFIQATTYMLIAICASVVPLYHWFEQISEQVSMKKLYTYGLHLFLILIVFRCIYIHIPIYGRSQICSVLSDMAVIRSGPAWGIITDEEGAARQRDSMAEWNMYVQEDDTIWILGEPVDTLGYLYEDVEVGAPTVMSTPTYNEELLYYWELNPEKYPDVVILACSYGELALELASNEWLMSWLEEEYCAQTVVDGTYWRYYIR